MNNSSKKMLKWRFHEAKRERKGGQNYQGFFT